EVASADLGEGLPTQAGLHSHGGRTAIAKYKDLRGAAAGRRRLWPDDRRTRECGEAARHIAQRDVRNAQDIIAALHDDLGRRRHAGLEQKILIGNADDRIICDDVLDRLRRLADLRDLTLERSMREGFHREGRLAAELDQTDVAFA